MRREPFVEARRDAPLDPDEDDLRPLPAPRPFARTRLAARFVFAAASIAGLAFVAREKAGAPAPRAWTEPPPSAVLPAVRQAAAPKPLLALEAAGPAAPSDMQPDVRTEPPRWNASTGLREDVLAQGSFAAIEAPYLRVTLSEAATAPQPAPSLFVTLARRAAETRGLSVVRTGMRGVVATKFGRFETVEATLSGEGARQCTGFASLDGSMIRIDGWLCGVLGQAPEPQALACALDGLTLAGPAVPTIEVAFGEAERRRGPACGQGAGSVGLHGSDRTGSIAGGGKGAGKGGRVRSPRLTKK